MLVTWCWHIQPYWHSILKTIYQAIKHLLNSCKVLGTAAESSSPMERVPTLVKPWVLGSISPPTFFFYYPRILLCFLFFWIKKISLSAIMNSWYWFFIFLRFGDEDFQRVGKKMGGIFLGREGERKKQNKPTRLQSEIPKIVESFSLS